LQALLNLKYPLNKSIPQLTPPKAQTGGHIKPNQTGFSILRRKRLLKTKVEQRHKPV
jgi:hypothetical protein